MKTKYFVETRRGNNRGLVWRKMGKKIEFTREGSRQTWRNSGYKTLIELDSPKGLIREVTLEELALIL